jgi:Protein of unknown function (DUF432)
MSSSTGTNSPDDDFNNIKWKMIGCTAIDDGLQNQIIPMMHECYQLGIIDHDTVASLVRFCLQFWMGHFRMKKQQFDMAQQDIEEEKKKLAAIVDQKGQAVVYAKMPIEIGVYRLTKDEEVLLNAFSLRRQQYALYGSPQSGVVCGYIETPMSSDKHEIKV